MSPASAEGVSLRASGPCVTADAVKAPQGQEPRMVASLLVYEDRVIGADLSARELGGMIRALEGETAEP